jgi:RNA polymerase sigma factor (sigma-70 family)
MRIKRMNRRQKMTDREIVIRLQAGDQTAFDELYERYSGSLFRSARVLLGNNEDAEDVLQETFVTCYFHIGELERPESVRYWLFRIMRRSAWRLGKKRRAETPNEDVNRLRDTAESGETGPEENILSSARLEELLSTLSQKQREVAVLYYLEEMSVPEIAEVLDCFEGTVKSRLFAARKKLKHFLDHEDEKKKFSKAAPETGTGRNGPENGFRFSRLAPKKGASV